MIVKILNIILLALFVILGIAVNTFLLVHNHMFLGLLGFGIFAATLIIFLLPKAYPLRFMYPGLITFLLFMVLPIIFTIYISFTNLSTGHFLSQEKVYEMFQQEVYIPVDAHKNGSHFFKLIKNDDAYSIIVSNNGSSLIGEFSTDDDNKQVQLMPFRGRLDSTPLAKGEVFALREQLKEFEFIHPEAGMLNYYRSNILSKVQKRYLPLEDDKFQDSVTGEVYYPNLAEGFYTNGKENLAPGFFVNVGLKNFTALFANPSIKSSFGKIILWTFIWATGAVVLTFALGMFLSLIINSKGFRFKPVYRALLIIPYSIPFFISVLVFKGMLNKDFGIINELLGYVGIAKISWLDNPLMAKVSCLMVNLWLGFPYMFLVTTGILQSIPNSVYEAAALDGAGRVATFRKITLPLIFSAVGPLLVGTFAFNLNNFVGIYLLTGGGPPIIGAVTPAGETDILISYTYRLAFEGGSGQDFGLASSIAIFIFIIITILTLINFRLSGMMKEDVKR